MTRALIGHTGFVGGNLAAQTRFDEFYNSKNIESIAGKQFDLLVCCGTRAEKWIANAQPEADKAGILRLTDVLSSVRANKVVLISTVDVYPNPQLVDEDSVIENQGGNAYGRHRYELEQWIGRRFEALVVRLPGLFGAGLKKNIVYDFLHGNQTDRIHRDSVYQFYDLSRLWSDIELCRQAALHVVNFATEPVSVADVARDAFGFEFTNAPASAPARYDFRTKYDRLFGGENGYLCTRNDVLSRMRDFVQSQLKRAA